MRSRWEPLGSVRLRREGREVCELQVHLEESREEKWIPKVEDPLSWVGRRKV